MNDINIRMELWIKNNWAAEIERRRRQRKKKKVHFEFARMWVEWKCEKRTFYFLLFIKAKLCLYEHDNIPQNLPANSAASDHDDVSPSTHHHLCVVRSLRLKNLTKMPSFKMDIYYMFHRIRGYDEKDQWLVVVFCVQWSHEMVIKFNGFQSAWDGLEVYKKRSFSFSFASRKLTHIFLNSPFVATQITETINKNMKVSLNNIIFRNEISCWITQIRWRLCKSKYSYGRSFSIFTWNSWRVDAQEKRLAHIREETFNFLSEKKLFLEDFSTDMTRDSPETTLTPRKTLSHFSL